MRASSSRAHRYKCLIWTTRETEVNVSRPRRLTLRRTHPNTEDPPSPTLLGRKAKPGTETSSQFYCGRVSVCRFRISLRWERERRTITSCKRDIKCDSDTGWGAWGAAPRSSVKGRTRFKKKKKQGWGFLKKGKKGGDNESTTGLVVAGKGRRNRGHFTLLLYFPWGGRPQVSSQVIQPLVETAGIDSLTVTALTAPPKWAASWEIHPKWDGMRTSH